VAYVEVLTPRGDKQIGSAFHVRDGVFVTCRHVVEGNQILNVATTTEVSDGMRVTHKPSVASLIEEPRFHPDERMDLAVIRTEGMQAPSIPMASLHPVELPILSPVIVMGYPPVPMSARPVLLAASAEVSAVLSTYDEGDPYIILSSMARGGFSGGVAIIPADAYGHEGALGMVTRSFVHDGQPTELGYLAILPIEIITSICHGLFHSRLDWYFSPNREKAALDTMRGTYKPSDATDPSL
jgi:hypothetical protein